MTLRVVAGDPKAKDTFKNQKNIILFARPKIFYLVQCDAIRSEQILRRFFLDIFNVAFRDEDNILDQIFWNLYHEDFEFQEWLQKMLI